jgi:hypothetical protein
METVSLISQAIAAVVATLVACVTPLLAARVLAYLHVRQSATTNAMVHAASARAAGLAYETLVTLGNGGWNNPVTRAAAIAKGVAYLRESMPETLAQCGIDQGKIEQLVASHLGTLLAADPSVAAGTSPQAPKGPTGPNSGAPGAAVPALVVPLTNGLADAAGKARPAWVDELRGELRTLKPNPPDTLKS